MFGTYFSSSLKALPVLILLPAISFILYALGVDTYLSDEGLIIINNVAWYKGSGGEGIFWMGAITIVAILVNFVFLMIIPAALGGLDPGKKLGQFYVGFFFNLAIMLLIPIILHIIYVFNGLTLGILIGLCLMSFLVPFIIGSRFVAPAYVRAFWFSY